MVFFVHKLRSDHFFPEIREVDNFEDFAIFRRHFRTPSDAIFEKWQKNEKRPEGHRILTDRLSLSVI
jgi:hypothetical protein